MAINGKAVLRVIIEGEWIWVERGSFTVIPLEFSDDNGNVMNPKREPEAAYYFVSTQGDPYFGPLSSISLFKLDSQTLEDTGTIPTPKGRPHALPEGSGETFGGVMGPRVVDDGPGDGAAPGSDAPAAKRVALFADDVPDDVEDEGDTDEDDFQPAERRRRGGLF